MTDLRIRDIRPFIPAQDFALCKDFYVALGFELTFSDAQLALLSSGSCSFYLQNYWIKDWSDNSMLHVTVADARACHEQVTALLATGRFPGARVAPPKQEPYGAFVTYVWDPTGVLLHLAEWTE